MHDSSNRCKRRVVDDKTMFLSAISIYESEASRLETAPEIRWWWKLHENQIFVRNRKVCMVSLDISISLVGYIRMTKWKVYNDEAERDERKKNDNDDEGSKPSECETSAKK